MQYNPAKLNLNHQNNTYQSYEAPPPPYSSYTPQSIGGIGYVTPGVQYYGQTSLYPQQNVVIVPTYRPFWKNHILTTITPNLRVFFIISGIIYLIWGLSAVGLEIALIIKSYSTFYRGIWAGSFLLGGGICMLIVACRTSYSMIHLIRSFSFLLFFCVLGLILSAINYGTSNKCSSKFSPYLSKYSCDNELISILKVTILIIFIVATFHTLINIIVLNNEHKKTLLKSTVPRVPNY